MTECVLVTDWEFEKAKAAFGSDKKLDVISASTPEDELAKEILARNCRAVIVGVDNYTGSLYEALGKTGGSNGAIIARFGVGHDKVDKVLAAEHNIIVTNTPGVLDDSVAEQTIWLIGTLVRQIALHDKNMKTGNWQPSLGSELKGRTLLIVGCGSIGRKVAKIAAFGFGMNVIGYDVMALDAEAMKQNYGINKIIPSLDEALAEADFVSIHLPAIEETANFVNKDFLSKMKQDAFLLNTSRGSIINENALYDFIQNGRIAGAGLDVYETEPYEPIDTSKDLRKLSQVVLTPHTGSSTIQACQGMAKSCMKNVKAFFEKEYNQLDIVLTFALFK